MSGAELGALLPLLLLGVTPIAVLVALCIVRSHRTAAEISLLGLAAAILSVIRAPAAAARPVTPLLVSDGYGNFYIAVIAAATFIVVLLSYDYLEERSETPEEFYILLLSAAFGAAVLAASTHFASFFLGLEILSVSLYGLLAYPHVLKLPLEAGLKYLVLAGLSSAFLLFGMALVYAETGTMEFGALAGRLSGGGGPAGALLISGTALILVGIGFKLAVFPFHMWTPDVYQGAPAPVTTFVATVSKGGVVALLLRYLHFLGVDGRLFVLLSTVAIASMIAGNLLALLQLNVKRILAYSSIAHLGYVLVALLAAGQAGATGGAGGATANGAASAGAAAATFYIVAYSVTMLGAFGVVTVLSPSDRDAERIEDYRGLFWRRPFVAVVFTAMLLSLAGIPLTAGFVGKFYLVASGAASGLWALILTLVVTSVVGLFYYLRIVIAIYATDWEHSPAEPLTAPLSDGVAIAARPSATEARHPARGSRLPSLSPAGGVALAAVFVLLLWLGVFPAPLVNMIWRAVTSLGS